MRFGFIGGTPRGFALFKALVDKNNIPEFCFILKEDDHENIKISSEFYNLSKTCGIESEVKKKLNSNDYLKIASLNLDFIIVCGWRTLIKIELNDSLKQGMIAAHDSLLPKYRGFAPLNWAIINGEKLSGITLFFIEEGNVDSGDIIMQKIVEIDAHDYAFDVYKKMTRATIECYLELFDIFNSSNQLPRYKQDDSLATYTCKRVPSDGHINWNQASSKVLNFIRALAYPYSGAFFFHQNKKYEIRTATLGPQNSKVFAGNIHGRIIGIHDAGVEVLCNQGSIMIQEIFDLDSLETVSANVILKSITQTLT